MYIDAHTHLNSEKLFENYDKYIEEFEYIGWKDMVNVAIDIDRAQKALDIQKNNKTTVNLYSSVWFHPSLVGMGDIQDLDFDDLIKKAEKFIFENRQYISFFGECGIDTHYDWWKSLDSQKKFFRMQCEVARFYNLPLIVHSRDDFDNTFDVLKDFPDLKIYFHCWWYWPDQVDRLQEYFENVWIWFTWNVTFPKAEQVRQSFLKTKKENLLMETDAPYLAPQKMRWKLNKPSYVVYTYDYCAKLLDMDLEDFKTTVKSNFDSLLG